MLEVPDVIGTVVNEVEQNHVLVEIENHTVAGLRKCFVSYQVSNFHRASSLFVNVNGFNFEILCLKLKMLCAIHHIEDRRLVD